jgi:hypothetical protein
MHSGSIYGNTAAARVYQILKELDCEWIGGWELTLAAHTTAVSTRIAEVRAQLPPGEDIGIEPRGKRFYYRLEKVGQLSLFAGV